MTIVPDIYLLIGKIVPLNTPNKMLECIYTYSAPHTLKNEWLSCQEHTQTLGAKLKQHCESREVSKC